MVNLNLREHDWLTFTEKHFGNIISGSKSVKTTGASILSLDNYIKVCENKNEDLLKLPTFRS